MAQALGWPQARLAKRRDLPKLFGFEAGGTAPSDDHGRMKQGKTSVT